VDKEGPLHKGNRFCQVPNSISKFYQDSTTFDVVDMDACYILLGQPWQYDIDATHRGKKSIYMLSWEGKRIAMKPIPSPLKSTKKEKPKFI